MASDIGKCRSGSNWREGSAVSAPFGSLGANSIESIDRGNISKDWAPYAAIIAKRWKTIGYYYTGDYINAATTADYATAASATAAVVTYTAESYGKHSIDGVSWSYSGGTPSGSLTIEDGSGNVIFSADITAEGPGFFKFENNLSGTTNTAMIITLSSGGTGVVGKINVLGHKIV